MIIGAVGIGAMGTPMARNLAAGGDRVLAFDIDRGAVDAVVGGAIQPAESAAAMAEECALIVIMVSDDAALRDVVFGRRGLMQAPAFTGCAADLSTTSVALAREVGEALKLKGGRFLDGGVIGGGVAAARDGTSPIVLAGDRDDFERHLPVLSRLGSCDFVGAQGNAKVVKIINNLLVGVITAANAEALSLGIEAGLDPGKLLACLANGSGDSTVLQSYMGRYVKDGVYGDGLIGHHLMAKDLSLACELADMTRTPAAFAELGRQLYAACGQALGGDAMFPSVFEYFRRSAGAPPPPKDTD